MANDCPVCEKRVPQDDTKAIYSEGGYKHRACQLRESGQFDLIDKLFRLQDEPDESPETAMSDLIGNIGWYVHEHNKKHRGSKRIDFAEALRRGLNFFREECQ